MSKRLFGLKPVDIFLILAAAAVLTVIIGNRIAGKAGEAKRTGITVLIQGEHIDTGVITALAEEFEQKNPDLRITLLAEAGPDGADIVFFDESEFPGLVRDSALAPLAPYMHTDAQTEQWALPLVMYMDLFLYNIDILQAANCDRPPKTRAEFLAAARAIAAKQAAFPLALGLDPSDPLALRRDIYPWVWQAGGELTNGTLSRAAADTIAFFGQLYREKLLAPDSFGKTGAQRLEEFAGGKIAMLAASSRDIPFLRQGGVNFGITAIPAIAPGKNRLGLSGLYAGISGTCAIPDEAWTFLAFIAGKSDTLAQTSGAVPGSFPSAGTAAFPGAYIAKDPLYAKAWDIFEAADIVEYNGADPSHEETERLMRERLAAVFQEASDLPAAR